MDLEESEMLESIHGGGGRGESILVEEKEDEKLEVDRGDASVVPLEEDDLATNASEEKERERGQSVQGLWGKKRTKTPAAGEMRIDDDDLYF